jgi:hypothetical protein
MKIYSLSVPNIKHNTWIFFYFEALYAVRFPCYNIHIRVQQLHYFIRDQIGYSIDVLQLTVNFISI